MSVEQQDRIGILFGLLAAVIAMSLGVGAAIYVPTKLSYLAAGVLFIATLRAFRCRMENGVYLVHNWSFEYDLVIAIGVTCAFLGAHTAMLTIGTPWVTACGIGCAWMGIGLCVFGFKEGPIYGWDEVFNPIVPADPSGPY